VSVIDVTDRAYPLMVNELVDFQRLRGPTSIAVDDNFAYVASMSGNSVTVIGLSTKFEIVGFLSDNAALRGACSIAVSGDFAYVVSYYSASVSRIDMRQKHLPRMDVSFRDSPILSGATSIAISGDIIYVASFLANSVTALRGTESGIILLESVNGLVPVGNNTFANVYGASSITISGDYAYVACQHYGLGLGGQVHVLNIGNRHRNKLTFVGSVNLTRAPATISVKGDYGFVALGGPSPADLIMLDVRQKTRPAIVATERLFYPLSLSNTGSSVQVIRTAENENSSNDIFVVGGSGASSVMSVHTALPPGRRLAQGASFI